MTEKTLIVIDMQNDFVTGSLGTSEAQNIVENVKNKIEKYKEENCNIFFTQDTHYNNYLITHEGIHLPIEHCIKPTKGWMIIDELSSYAYDLPKIQKNGFGYPFWDNAKLKGDIEIIGLCTDICVISNALIIRSEYPDAEITVDASCCAGTTPENHRYALEVMKSCQINVIGE